MTGHPEAEATLERQRPGLRYALQILSKLDGCRLHRTPIAELHYDGVAARARHHRGVPVKNELVAAGIVAECAVSGSACCGRKEHERLPRRRPSAAAVGYRLHGGQRAQAADKSSIAGQQLPFDGNSASEIGSAGKARREECSRGRQR